MTETTVKVKAEMGAYSSVVGNSVHLLAEDGRMLGQVAILCHTDDLRDKDVQTALCRTICDAINAPGGPVTVTTAAKVLLEALEDEKTWPLAVNAATPILRADMAGSCWNTTSEIKDALRAALRSLAEGDK